MMIFGIIVGIIGIIFACMRSIDLILLSRNDPRSFLFHSSSRWISAWWRNDESQPREAIRAFVQFLFFVIHTILRFLVLHWKIPLGNERRIDSLHERHFGKCRDLEKPVDWLGNCLDRRSNCRLLPVKCCALSFQCSSEMNWIKTGERISFGFSKRISFTHDKQRKQWDKEREEDT